MKCPVCSESLMRAERQGVEIDFCPKCHGIWLDRGELDKIRLREAALEAAAATRDARGWRERDDDEDDPYPRRKRSIWYDVVD